MREWTDPGLPVGRQLHDVVVGWHVVSDQREPVLLWLLLDDQWVEVCTAGDGSLGFALAVEPVAIDMAELGQFEMEPADSTHPLQPLIGSVLSRVGRVTWRRTDVGLVLVSSAGTALLVNDADQIFVSRGELPPDYQDAVVD